MQQARFTYRCRNCGQLVPSIVSITGQAAQETASEKLCTIHATGSPVPLPGGGMLPLSLTHECSPEQMGIMDLAGFKVTTWTD